MQLARFKSMLQFGSRIAYPPYGVEESTKYLSGLGAIQLSTIFKF